MRDIRLRCAGFLLALWATPLCAQAQDILIGYLPPSAGPFATFARTNEIAAQIAIDEANASDGVGGKKVRLMAFDTAGKPSRRRLAVFA